MKQYLIEGVKKPDANGVLAYFTSLCLIPMAVLGVLFWIVDENRHVFLLVFMVLGVFEIVANNLFNWELNRHMHRGGKYIEYKYNMPVSGMGNNGIRVSIKRVDDFVVKGGRLILRGEFLEKQPMLKEKEVNKLVMKNLSSNDIMEIKEMLGIGG